MKHRSRLIKASRKLTTVNTINMTPLIDLAFALLIIFIIATPLMEQSIPLDLPVESPNPGSQREDIEFQIIAIDRTGQIFWGNTPVDLDTLSQFLARIAQQPSPPVLSIRGDASLPYQSVVDVIDLVKQHQLEKISLDTQVK
jgi:biopolymer transport protein ExbD